MVNNSTVYGHSIPQSVYVLLLIENSSGLFNIWPDLRDYHLGPLLQKIELDHPSIPVTTFVLESLPANPTQNKRPVVPRQYRTCHDGLLDVRFNHSPSNRLTYSKIEDAARFITSAMDSNGSVLLHIVIAAASPPLEEKPAEPEPGTSYWSRLAEHLAKADVRCHLMLKYGQDWDGLTNLFEEMLQLQQITEEKPWFPIDMHKIIVRLSSQKKLSQKDNKAQEPGNFEASQLPPSPTKRIQAVDASLPYPISPTAISTASGSSTPGSPPESPQEALPSLVSQLQQVHGLTKKKVYGAKPARKPFVSGEVYHGDPVTDRKSLSLSPESTPLTITSHGGKTPSPSTFDRSSRRYQASSSGSRPHPKSRGSYDTATASYTPSLIYDPSWLRQNSSVSGGSVSLPGSPPPYVSLTHAPPDYTQPESPWSSASASPAAVTTSSSSYEFPSLSSKHALPPTSVSHRGHHASQASSIASAAYPHTSHSSTDSEQFPVPPQQQPSSSLSGGSHIQSESITHPLSHYVEHFSHHPTFTTTSGGEETLGTETDLSNKNSGTMPWDPNIYRNELLSHLTGPAITATDYVPSTYGTRPHETTANMNDKGTLHSTRDLERPDGAETSPQTFYPYEDWQPREQTLNTQYPPTSASFSSRNSRRQPSGSNSLTNWAG